MTELHFFEEASNEVEEARGWYRERSETAEMAFLNELDHAIAVVVEAPNRWPKHSAGTRRYVFPTFPYSLIYFTENRVLHVVAVSHEKRRPGYLISGGEVDIKISTSGFRPINMRSEEAARLRDAVEGAIRTPSLRIL